MWPGLRVPKNTFGSFERTLTREIFVTSPGLKPRRKADYTGAETTIREYYRDSGYQPRPPRDILLPARRAGLPFRSSQLARARRN